ncbi:MAG: hypothetical protein ACREVE_14795 [Gammaproteobacteria bacterium]
MRSLRPMFVGWGEDGIRVEAIDLIEGRPEYLRFSSLTYLGGWLYERLVNTIPLLDRFRILLVAEMRKA